MAPKGPYGPPPLFISPVTGFYLVYWQPFCHLWDGGSQSLSKLTSKGRLLSSNSTWCQNQCFSKDLHSGLLSATPNDFFNRVETRSILLKRSPCFSFYKDGILIDGENKPIKADMVIFETGFKGIQKLQSIFMSQDFRDLIAPSPNSRVSLYRECFPPRIPQIAIIEFSESISNLLISEMRSRWVVELLDGKFKLPSIKEMEKDISNWDEYMKKYSGEYHQRSHSWFESMVYDQLCKDMGWKHKRKNGIWAELFEPYGPMDYIS